MFYIPAQAGFSTANDIGSGDYNMLSHLLITVNT